MSETAPLSTDLPGASPVLFLFDIDGTLVRTEGSSRHGRAFRAAFLDVYGSDCRFASALHGMTDLQIYMTVSQEMGLVDGEVRAMAERACRRMVEIYQIPEDTDGTYLPLPGAQAAVETLVHRGILTGLLTGNAPEIAHHKLATVGLSEFFPFGAYGIEAEERSALPPIAISRAEALVGHPLKSRDVFIVGDTPRDVACALNNGCRSIAVATGHFSVAELAAAGAELVLPDLEDFGTVLRLLETA